jgi:hypothetical protein
LGEIDMTDLPKDRLAALREKVDQQRNTIEALRREGHQCPDAELQLKQMLIELQASEQAGRRI